MIRRGLFIALVAMAAALLAAHASSLRAQPVTSITLPQPGGTVHLYPGCNPVALTFPDGAPTWAVVEAVSATGAVQAMWRHNVAQNRFERFSPAAPQSSDLLTVDFLDAVWICLAGAPVVAQPPTPPNRFFGDVTLGGAPAPPGTKVTATIDGTVCGQTAVAADSTYVLDVVSSGQIPGCGTEGATVDFWVAGYPAGTATWHSGQFTELDLSAITPDANVIAVDASAETEPVGTTVTRFVGAQFEVSVNIAQAATPYQGYQAKVQFDPYDPYALNVLAYADPPGVTYMSLGGMVLDAPPGAGPVYVWAGSGLTSGTTTATGQAHRIAFECVAEGTSPLHLVALEQDPWFGSSTLAPGGGSIPTALIDASVTCRACPYPDDTDCDGCADAEEVEQPDDGLEPLLPGETGGFDPEAWYDFFDVPVPAMPDPTPNGRKNQAINMGDVLAVLFYVPTSPSGTCGDDPNGNGVDYDCDKGMDTDGDTVAEIPPDGLPDGQNYDRTPSTDLNPPWDAGPPDGAVAMADVLTVLAQVLLNCVDPP